MSNSGTSHMSAPDEAEEDLQNPDAAPVEGASPLPDDIEGTNTAVQPGGDLIELVQDEQEQEDDRAKSSVDNAERPDTVDDTAENMDGDQAAVQSNSGDPSAESSDRQNELDAALSPVDEGYYPHQEERPIWGSSTVGTSEQQNGDAGAQGQQSDSSQPSPSQAFEDSTADSGLQSGQPLSAGPAAAEVMQAALSNPELDPDHPLLQRAQKALEKQLLATKYRLESEVREKSVALQVCLLACLCILSLFSQVTTIFAAACHMTQTSSVHATNGIMHGMQVLWQASSFTCAAAAMTSIQKACLPQMAT